MKILLLAIVLILSSCATGLRETSTITPKPSRRTVVLFLVDGLSVKTLQTALKQNRLPNLRRFFLRENTQFALGQASFPTLTYPNISGVLTTKPMGEQPVIANHVLQPSGKLRNYEDHKSHEALRALIDPLTVISRLEAEGRESATFSYIFGLNAASRMRVGIQEGLDYQRGDYMSLDDRLLTSLNEFLLERGDPWLWPDFIYVHLVGVDAVSHRFGHRSRETMEYLTWLDGRMGAALKTLAKGEKRKQLVTLLTSDHGFVETKRHVSLKKKMVKADLELVISNEGRFLGLHLPKNRPAEELDKALKIARAQKGVELTAWRRGNELEIATEKSRFRFAFGPASCRQPFSLAAIPENNILPASFKCLGDFDDHSGQYPFLVSQLALFLTSPGHPDAVVIAKPHVSFAKGAKSSHGGPTADETFVPVLSRGATLQGPGAVPTNELLKVLFQPRGPSIENMNAKPSARQARAQ